MLSENSVLGASLHLLIKNMLLVTNKYRRYKQHILHTNIYFQALSWNLNAMA